MRRTPSRPPLRSELRYDDPYGEYIDDRPPIAKMACHGEPERCLGLHGRPMPLCSRCTGFYTGLLFGLPWGALMAYMGMGSIMALVIFLATSAPLALDGITQYMGLRRSNNKLRLVTGLASGFGGGMGASYLFCMVLGIF